MKNFKLFSFVLLLFILNSSFVAYKAFNKQHFRTLELNKFYEELDAEYQLGKSITVVDPTGKELINPNIKQLRSLSPKLFSQNRVRVTLESESDNNLCSTELVIMDQTGNLEGNYSINNCSSYGWIFFTEANCFDVALYHDAGSEAPFGRSVNGSVDWTFKFNDESKISGTYMDLGAALMYKVASPCYEERPVRQKPMIAPKRIYWGEHQVGE